MADPTGISESIAIASLVAGVASTGVAVAGQLSAADARQKQANYQAAVAANNATTASNNARYAIQAGEVKASQEALRQRNMRGQLIAGLAASGIDPNSGSALDVRETQRETGLTDVEQTRHNALLTAYGYQTQSNNFTAQAGLDKMTGDQAKTAGLLGATGSLLSGVSSLGDKWAKWSTVGGNSGSSSSSAFGSASSDASNPATYG